MDSTRLWIASATTATSGLRTASTSGNDRTAWNISRQRPKSDDAGRMAKAIDIFTTMCRYNTRHKNADDASVVTPFHSVAEPPVSLTVYMDRVDVQTNCGEEGVLLGMILIGRYHALTKVLPSVLSMHRLLLVATRLAVKAHHDVFRSNRTYARAGGLDLREVNDLELYLLSKLDYRVVVSHEQLKHFRNQLSLAATATTDAALAQHVACGIDPNAVPPQPNVLTTSSSVDATQTASGAAAVAVRTIRSTATNNNSNNTSTNGSALVSSSSRNTAAGASSSIRGASVMSPSDRRRGPASGSSANLLSPNTAAPDDGALLSDSVQAQRGSSTVVAASGKGRPPSVHHAVPPAPSASRNSGRPHS